MTSVWRLHFATWSCPSMLNKNHDEKMAALATWVFALALARCPWVRSRARLAFPLHSVICMLQDGYDLYENTNYYCVDNEDLMRVPSRFPGSIVVGVAAQREEVVFPVAEHRPSGGGGRCGWCAAGPVRLSNWPPDSKRDGGGGARLRLSSACRRRRSRGDLTSVTLSNVCWAPCRVQSCPARARGLGSVPSHAECKAPRFLRAELEGH